MVEIQSTSEQIKDSGKAYPFTVELRDEANDLAVLKVENIPADQCQPLTITDQEKPLSVGDDVLKMCARNGDPEFTAGVVKTYFRREDARGLPLPPGEDRERSMLSVITKVNYRQGGDSGGPVHYSPVIATLSSAPSHR